MDGENCNMMLQLRAH